jgi:hypothetical protein
MEKKEKLKKEPKEKKGRESASKLPSSVKKPKVKSSAPKDLGVSKLFEYPKI